MTYLAAGCGLELGGLAAVPDASSGSTATSLGDAAVAAEDAGVASGTDDGSTGSGAAEEAGSPSASDATTPPSVQNDANVEDVRVIVGADASPITGGDPCDLDQDGFRAIGQACGGTDCCDTDGRVHPTQTSFFTAASGCSSFDYDCNGADETEFAVVSCAIGFFSCSGSGFAGAVPACGVIATFDTCNLTIGCSTAASQVAQGCR